jgi:hypothetical protein
MHWQNNGCIKARGPHRARHKSTSNVVKMIIIVCQSSFGLHASSFLQVIDAVCYACLAGFCCCWL